MTEFHVPEMSCGHCKAAIENAVASVDPNAEVEVDLDTRRVRVTTASATGALLDAMKTAGYDATALT